MISTDFLKKLDSPFLFEYEKDFLFRVYNQDQSVYYNRLKAIGFVNKNIILDAGCGYGQWSFALSTMNEEIIGIDNDENKIEICKKISNENSVPNVDFLDSSLEEIPLDESCIDAAFSYSVLYFTDYEQSIKEIYRILKKDGLFYFNTNDLGWYIYNMLNDHNPSNDFSSEKMAIETISHTLKYLQTGNRELGKRLVMDIESTLELLKSVGFEIINYGGDGTINLNNTDNVKQFHPSHQYGLVNQYEILCKKK